MAVSLAVVEQEKRAFRSSAVSHNSLLLHEAASLYHTDLIRFASRMGFSPADADDVVQNTWLAFVSNPERFEGRSALRSYLFGILYNKAREQFRVFKKDNSKHQVSATGCEDFAELNEDLSLNHGPEFALLGKESVAKINTFVQNLPDLQKKVFFLRLVEGHSTHEVCQELDISSNNLAVIIYRIRRALQQELDDSN